MTEAPAPNPQASGILVPSNGLSSGSGLVDLLELARFSAPSSSQLNRSCLIHSRSRSSTPSLVASTSLGQTGYSSGAMAESSRTREPSVALSSRPSASSQVMRSPLNHEYHDPELGFNGNLPFAGSSQFTYP
jgi:hypothetical protein